jgi:hypothetical protein
MSEFSKCILNKTDLHQGIESIERLSGRTENHARTVAEEMIKDIRVATYYPPETIVEVSREELLDYVNQAVLRIQESRAAAESEGKTTD